MARAMMNAMVHTLSGKLGNGVWVRSREGTMVRQLVTPTNPDTPAQVAVRTRLTEATRLYASFNASQTDLWEDYAEAHAVRDDVTFKTTAPTGINVFVKLATKWRMVNPTGSIPTTPPVAPYGGDTITMTAVAGTGKITFTASAANNGKSTTELLLQKLKSKGRSPQKGGYRSKGFKKFTNGSLEEQIAVGPGWYAAAYRFVNTDTGEETGLVPLPVMQVSLSVESGASGSNKKAA